MTRKVITNVHIALSFADSYLILELSSAFRNLSRHLGVGQPWMPLKQKRSTNQHNRRNDSGTVAPGKRVAKEKSNGHINEGAEEISDRDTSGKANNNVGDKYSGKVPEHAGAYINGSADGLSGNSHRQIDFSTGKGPIAHDTRILNLALTILWSCPIGDTIAILIFLLSLPPTFLALTNTLFAILTFMPPATSISTFPTTLNDVFQGSGGAPSFATIVLTDFLGLVLWLVLWTPAQALVLELGQAVVATTLGGGSSVKSKGSDYTIWCMGFVVVSNFARNKWIPNRFFGYDWSVRLASLSNISLGPASFLRDNTATDRTYAGWYRVLIALHILVQGLVHVVRRWYAKREHQRPRLSKAQSDPEAVIESPIRSEAGPPANFYPAPSISQDLTARSSLPNMRDTREKTVSNKKKKKQGHHVRSQQPLWAAFAATKVTICREYDQSKMLQEGSGSDAKDTKNLGSAPFTDEEGQVWITHVGSNSFSFATSHLANQTSGCDQSVDTDAASRAGGDQSRPFHLRINGAPWTSVVVKKLSTCNGEDESAERQWTGEAFGLSPSSSYICSFIRSEDDVEIFTANLSTQSSPSVDQGLRISLDNSIIIDTVAEISASATPPLQRPRPASPTTPTTTLKNSIAACDATLNESQARQKRCKKEGKAASLALRKEIDGLNSRIVKIGVDDKAQHSRQLQWNQHIRQADEAIAAMSNELDSMDSIPQDDTEQWTETKREWERGKSQKNKAREELLRCKETAHEERSAVQAEGTSTQQKRDRLTTRGTQLNEKHQRLMSATAQGLSERERREAEVAAKAADRRQFEERSQEQVTQIQKSIQEVQVSAQQAWQQVHVFSSAHQRQQSMNAAIDEPIIPQGDIPGAVAPPTSMAASNFRFPGYASTEQPTMRGGSSTTFRYDVRPRSTSVLSGNSVYADSDDQDPAPPMPSLKPIAKFRGRQESGSSGSGSGSSQRDPMSPAFGGVRMSSTEKKGSPIWN